ncbi:hypothetical protein QTO34_012974, partial [Cnephaeus nilssonii]
MLGATEPKATARGQAPTLKKAEGGGHSQGLGPWCWQKTGAGSQRRISFAFLEETALSEKPRTGVKESPSPLSPPATRGRPKAQASLGWQLLSRPGLAQGLGSGPHIFMVGPEDEGIRLMCTGKRWFPQPEVQWKDVTGEKIPSLSEDRIQDNDGLFQIEVSLVVRDSSKREVSCIMKNPFFRQEQGQDRSREEMFGNWGGIGLLSVRFGSGFGGPVSDPFFPRTSPWKVAFTCYCIFDLERATGKEESTGSQGEKTKIKPSQSHYCILYTWHLTDCYAFQELYNQDWRKAGLYADWRKEHFKAVAVTLDPDTAHTKLILSESRKHVSSIENVSQNNDGPTQQEKEDTFSVLGQSCFTTGRHYWEAEVNVGTEGGPGTRWALGVCSDTVKREGWFVESPEKNFWVVAYKEGEIRVLTSQPESLSVRQHPHRIGVFLDWEAGDVSFYNMGPGTSVAICLASDHTENCPDSSPKTSVTHSRSSDMGVPQEANSVTS